MGEISRQLRGKLKAMASNVLLPRSTKGRKPSPQTPDIEKPIAEGIDPVHAAYVFVHHITSVFAENVSQLPKMQTFTKEVGKAEDEYLPDGPPMSPLTRSYFTSWAFFDYRIGETTDTLASCLIDANDIIWMNPDQLHALKEMNESRIGIYEHQGWQENYVRLRELITDRDAICRVSSGYRGKAGELWYARLLPPLVPRACHVPCNVHHALRSDRCDEEGLDRFLETQHGGHQGFQRSRSPSLTLEVWSQDELLERVRPPCLSSSSKRHLPIGHPRSEIHVASCMRRSSASPRPCQTR